LPPTDLAAVVRRTVRQHVPSAWQTRDVPDTTPLGRDGLGLDSVGIVELLLDCEQASGVSFPMAAFGERPLTVGILVEHVQRDPR
jgi:acyl carrier protein